MDFRDELFKFLGKIDEGEHFAISRYGDGERSLIEGNPIGEGTQARLQDKRQSEGMTKLGQALRKTLDIKDICFYYAIPCQCCNNNGKWRYIENLESNNFTYANLFINNNYQYFKERLNTLDKEVILIANWEGQYNKYPFKIKQFISIPDDCVNYYENNEKEILSKFRKLAKENKNQLFFISAGPLANVIVYEMYKTNPNNTYIDMGSALDEWTKQRITRGFQRREDKYAQKYCKF